MHVVATIAKDDAEKWFTKICLLFNVQRIVDAYPVKRLQGKQW